MPNITVNLYLYGDLARYGHETASYGFAALEVSLPEGSTLHDILTHLGMRTEERGITFINGKLSAMPGLQPDLDCLLNPNDRVAFFDLKSMWPFQYRHGAIMTDGMAQILAAGEDRGLHHAYDENLEHVNRRKPLVAHLNGKCRRKNWSSGLTKSDGLSIHKVLSRYQALSLGRNKVNP